MESNQSRAGPRIRPKQIREEAALSSRKPPIAACLGMLPELFFGPYFDLREENAQDREVRENEARAICENCAVEIECLWGALQNEEGFGVWGGLSHQERHEFGKFLKNRKRRGSKKRSKGVEPANEAELEALVREWVWVRKQRPYARARPEPLPPRIGGIQRKKSG